MERGWITCQRLEALSKEGTTAHRIFSGRESWIERFGSNALISATDKGTLDKLLSALDAWCASGNVSVERIFFRHLVKRPGLEDRPILVRGDVAQDGRAVVLECGLQYEIDFSTGYSVGLFCDQRENRKWLRGLRPQKVLNTFAYTCAFSVAAAAVGAETWSVDLSKRSLEWGKRNFVHNGLDLLEHRFFADDVFRVLPRLARRREKFDVVILDPPTFSRNRDGKAFRVERDFASLVKLAASCLERPGTILLSTNARVIRRYHLEQVARAVLPGCETHFVPSPEEYGPGEAATTLWVQCCL